MKAFPHKRPVSNGEWCGMDLRDYFAAKALVSKEFQTKPYNTTESVAKECYAMADAMMKAREQ
jgi:hypothetical protein